MPLFGQPIAAYAPIANAKAPRNVTLPINIPTEIIATVDLSRKGHRVKNTGTSKVSVSYGVRNPANDGWSELYKIDLTPGDIYLYDIPEIVPFSAISTTGGTVEVIELV